MIDPKNWKNLQNDITTDSLWVSSTSTNNRPMFSIPKRDWGFKNSTDFHGIFIPEIPYQFIKRLLPENGIVWDCFAGSGTTYRVAKYLGVEKNCICTDLTPTKPYIKKGNAIDYVLLKNADLIFCHPPYMDTIKYSNKREDGSNFSEVSGFLYWLNRVGENLFLNLNQNGYVILVLGNVYKNGEELTLGVWGKDAICEGRKFVCKSHIVKDYGETKGTEGKKYNLNYYRQLRGGYNNFYGDNIFILKKGGRK